jgi:hypothetical protein
VIGWLYTNYAGDLDTSGKKALRLKANGNRRSADVLLVAPFKKFVSYTGEGAGEQTFVEGVLFRTTDNVNTVNYPKQHSENMTAKHQLTGNLLKPTVRMFKNIRNKMVERNIIKEGSAPSYFIEGMLSNVPPEHFSANRQATVEACWSWVNNCDHSALMCGNGIHPLVRDNERTSWPIQGYIDYLKGVQTLWNSW